MEPVKGIVVVLQRATHAQLNVESVGAVRACLPIILSLDVGLQTMSQHPWWLYWLCSQLTPSTIVLVYPICQTPHITINVQLSGW